jgi:SnoaL-like protein
VSDSPIQRLVEAMDGLDVDGLAALFAPGGRLMTADGRQAEGAEALRALLTEFFAALRSTEHRITAQWHQDNVWIAEIAASYELRDWLRLTDLPRVFIVREGSEGIHDLRVYGAHEHKLTDHRTGEEGMWIGSRWIPPL